MSGVLSGALEIVRLRLQSESEHVFVKVCLSFDAVCVPVQLPLVSQLRYSASSWCGDSGDVFWSELCVSV